MNLIFCMLINIKLAYKLIPLILVDMARTAQITQKKQVCKIFSSADKPESLTS